MREETNKITVSFHLVDQFGNTYDSSSTSEVFYDMGDDDLLVIGEKLNAFLAQCGYYRGGDTMLMESLTEDEFEEVIRCLSEYRDRVSKE